MEKAGEPESDMLSDDSSVSMAWFGSAGVPQASCFHAAFA
jgi:hypothetical protein